ncbi:sensor histidine kinase [Salinisphaera sp. SPP-AMP-43]|uniref:sensor histidine kinase n=1 Tax=Salinisphaera sp. SPP-AMP-43 TaxID=3121288 RepID=UPI003C6E63A6
MIEISRSLRARLALWLAAGAALLGTVLLIDAWLDARTEARRAYDAQLDDAALAIADGIRWSQGQATVSISAAALRMLSTDQQERVFYAVFNRRGQQLAANLDLSIPNAWRNHLDAEGAWHDLYYDDTDWRIHGRVFDLAGWGRQQANLQIWVGHTTAGRDALARSVFWPALIRFCVLIAAAAALGVLAIASALAPLARLRERLRERAPDDLSPLSVVVPRELGEFVHTLDGQLAGQRAARTALLRLTADASHQLRTPLAGLRASAETALAETDPVAWRQALERICCAAGRTSHLADQLLHIARLDRTVGMPQQQLDLDTLAAEATLDWVDRESASDHDLGFETDGNDAPIRGTPWALRALIDNLIDNALRYTPAGSTVTVAVVRAGAGMRLSVTDNGPGVTEAELATLHQAFDRGRRHDDSGSGLGLAIMATVAQQHSAHWQICNGAPNGLCVVVTFPIAEPDSGHHA